MTCMVYDHVAKSDLIKKKSVKYSPTVANVFENKFGQVVEKPFDFFCVCLFGFVKARKFRDSNKFSDCVQNVWANYYKNEKKLQSAKGPWYEFRATVFRRTCR